MLMDIRMPELDGLEATRRILAADPAARVLILTTFDLDEYVYEALQAGASGFVLKDDPPEQLIAAVRTVAAGDALLSPAVTKRVIRQFARLPRPAPPPGVDELTARELEIFRLIAEGLSNAEIGERLFIGDTTVKTHVTHILQKLGLRDRVQAVVLAYQTGRLREELASSSVPRRNRPRPVAPRPLGGGGDAARQREVCAAKERYASEAEARSIAVMNAPRGRAAATRPYRCDVCGGWHLTREGSRT